MFYLTLHTINITILTCGAGHSSSAQQAHVLNGHHIRQSSK